MIVPFRSFIFLLIFCLIVLSIYRRRTLKSPTKIAGLSFPPFSSANFCFIYFLMSLSRIHKYLGLVYFHGQLIYFHYKIYFFVPGNTLYHEAYLDTCIFILSACIIYQLSSFNLKSDCVYMFKVCPVNIFPFCFSKIQSGNLFTLWLCPFTFIVVIDD